MKSRAAVVNLVESWVGKKESDGSFKEIINIYNSAKKLPRGIKMDYSWAWCAATWSALAIKLGYTDIMPIEMSCGFLIDEAKKMGCWVENDAYTPNAGDACLYDWQDSGKGDNTGWPDHIGTVTYVNPESGYFIVTEGNYSDSVKKRTVSLNGRYIRGFITPKYDCMASDNDEPVHDYVAGKPNYTVALEVIAGIWGNGEKRKTNLKLKGYDPVQIQAIVNSILNDSAYKPKDDSEQNQKQPVEKQVTCTCYATQFLEGLGGYYKTTANLYLRNDAGTNKKALCLIPKGTTVNCYGYYTPFNGYKWLLVEVIVDGTKYTGFCHAGYLEKE